MKRKSDASRAFWLEDGRLACGSADDFFPFLNERGHIVSLVGGGGKTTLLYYLAEGFCLRGLRTAVMTTTKIGCPDHWCESIEACLSCWEEGAYAVCGERLENGKFREPPSELKQTLLHTADAIVIEADGARRLPCKAPAAHEPVILPETDIVIAVMGLDALGKPVEETCFRPELVCPLLRCSGRHPLTCEDMASLLLNEAGSRKGVGDRDYYIVLNKCDDAQRFEGGKRLLELLQSQGHTRAVLTSGMIRSEKFEYAR